MTAQDPDAARKRSRATEYTVSMIVEDLAATLEQENPRFDRKRFIDACSSGRTAA